MTEAGKTTRNSVCSAENSDLCGVFPFEDFQELLDLDEAAAHFIEVATPIALRLLATDCPYIDNCPLHRLVPDAVDDTLSMRESLFKILLCTHLRRKAQISVTRREA